MGDVLEVFELLETDDPGRHEFIWPLIYREFVVAQDAEIADSQQSISDFLELTLLTEQKEGYLRVQQAGQPGSNGSTCRQPVRPLYQS